MQSGTESQQPSIGKFGKFILRKRIGTGGMAEVFLAEMVGPEGFGKLVALKRMLPHLSDDEGFTESFISEARLGGSLNHPNIVQTLELGREGDHYYLAMEYIQGMTLAQLLRQRKKKGAPLPLSVVLDIARQMCDGLAYAHAATDPRGNPLNMVHRDLKPDNILLSKFGMVKITDFGVAKAASNLHKTVNQVVKGTVAYMSPEQALGEQLDHRSDLYSLGSILFEMLTLEPLYPNANGFPGLFRVQKGDISDRLKLLESYPDRLGALISRILSVDRNDRPTSAREIKQELTAISATVPASLLDIADIVRDALDRLVTPRLPESFAEKLGPSPGEGGAPPPQTLVSPSGGVASGSVTPADGHLARQADQLTTPSSPSLAQPLVRKRAMDMESGSSVRDTRPDPGIGPSSDAEVRPHSSINLEASSSPDVQAAPPPTVVESLWHKPGEGADLLPSPASTLNFSEEEDRTELLPAAPSSDQTHLLKRSGVGETSALAETARKPGDGEETAPIRTRLESPQETARPADENTFPTRSRRRVVIVVLSLVVFLAGTGLLVTRALSPERPVAIRPMVAPTASSLPDRQESNTPPTAAPVLPRVGVSSNPVTGAGRHLEGTPRPSAGESPANQPGAKPISLPPHATSAPASETTANVAGTTTETVAKKPEEGAVKESSSTATTRGTTARSDQVPESAQTKPHVMNSTTRRGHGYLSVFARPWAYVYLDGKKLGETTPLSNFRVTAGRHSLTFKTEDGRTRGPIVVTIGVNERKVMDPIIFE